MLGRLKSDLIAKARDWYRRGAGVLSEAELSQQLCEGARFHREGDLRYAEKIYRRALAAAPDDPNALHLLGVVALHQRNFDEAERMIRAAVEIAPDTPDFLNNFASLLSETGRPEEAASVLRHALRIKPDAYRAGANLLFLLNLLPGEERRAMFNAHVNFARMHLPEPNKQLHRRQDAADLHGRRLRIGYVSADFGAHPVGRILLGVLPCHDRSQVEVHCYSNTANPDHLTEKFRERAEHWHDIHGLEPAEAARRIAADGIDILVDLSGYTRGNSLPVFALRPAPVQVSWLGYFNTTGMSQIDWRITSPLADPPGVAGQFHTERLWFLQDSLWPWNVVEATPLASVAEASRAASGEIVFASFNSFRKVNTTVMQAWAEILRRAPDARLRMYGVPLGATVDRVYDLFESQGIATERVALMAPAPYELYLQSYAQVDIALDTFPYSGGATACECLWMGVPVIALAGAGGFARTSTCVLQSLGLDELVAQNPAQYIDAAVALAGDPERIRAYRRDLRQRMRQSPAGDPAQFTRRLEQAYAAMWEEWTQRRNAPEGVAATAGDTDSRSAAVAEERLASRAREAGRLGDAERHYRRAIELDPQSAVLHYNLGLLLHEVGDVDGAEAHYRQSLRFEPARHETHSSLLCLADFKPGLSRTDNLEAHLNWGSVFADGLDSHVPFTRVRDPERALRIGYVSGDFGGHVIGGFVAPLLEYHSPAFETYCYSTRNLGDAHRERLQSLAANWRDIAALDDDAAAAAIRADGIDILIDLAGHSAGNRLPVFARKPAPLQMTWMGYLNTTGMAAMDYRITDWGSDPAGAEQWCREGLLRLPHPQWCYVREDIASLVQGPDAPLSAGDSVTLGCATRFMKINDSVMALWMEILRSVPETRLRIIDVPDHPRVLALQRRVAEAGLSERVEWLPTQRGQAYWEYLASLDIVLDPFPYTGATTTFDCLRMNVPVVTLAGVCGPARSAAGILAEMGLAELAAASPRDYVAIASSLARDHVRRAALRTSLRDRLKASACCDPVRFTRNFESMCRDAWRRWCAEQGVAANMGVAANLGAKESAAMAVADRGGHSAMTAMNKS